MSRLPYDCGSTGCHCHVLKSAHTSAQLKTRIKIEQILAKLKAIIMNFGGTLRLNKFACFTVIFILFLIIYWKSGSTSFPMEKSDLINLKSLLKASIQAAERGGKKVMEGKSHDLNIKSKGKTLEGVNDPVTDADYASHCAMYYGLKNTFEKLTVVSEEHSKSDATCEKQPVIDIDKVLPGNSIVDYMNDELVYVKDVTVWIDPLDATKEYTGKEFSKEFCYLSKLNLHLQKWHNLFKTLKHNYSVKISI